MTAIDMIKSFKEFNVGDFVVTDNQHLFQIVRLPRFKYTVRYSDGDWDTYYVDDFESIRSSEWEMIGYQVKYQSAVTHEFAVKNYKITVQYELYDSIKHDHLKSKYKAFQIGLAKEALDNQLDELDEIGQ